MKTVQKLLDAIVSFIKVPEARETTKEGVVIYRLGKLRTVRLRSPSAWCATLSTWDRPANTVAVPGKIYNGSSYVDCMVFINSSGEVRVQDMFGGNITGAQYNYLRPLDITYFVE